MSKCDVNPFSDLAKQIRLNYDPTQGNCYYPECDSERIQKKKAVIAQRKDKDNVVRLDVSPSPFLGNVKEAKIVLLSLNPGFGDLNVGGWPSLKPKPCINPKKRTCPTRQEYRDIEAREMELKSQGFGDTILNAAFQAMNGTYWLEKMRKHLMAAKGYAKDSAEEKDALNKFALIDRFPYHSKKSPMSLGGILPSQQWIFDCVMPQVLENADLIIIVRAEKLWLESVPALKGCKKVYCLNSPQNSTISKGNMPEECWEKLLSLI